jgi:hypothetical protein
VLCATRTGTSFTVAAGGRGFDDTTASAHPNQALVQHTFSATDAREANAHVNATAAAHAATAIAFTPGAGIAATTVQVAIEEVVGDVTAAGYITTTDANAAYLPKAGAREWASASALIATFGAPTLAGIGAAGDKTSLAWLLDATATENLTGQVLIPSGWTTADIVLWWTNAGTGTGSVRWALLHEAQISNGDTLGGALSANDAVSSVAPAQNVTKVEFLKTAVAVAAGQVLGFRVQRLGGHADDTLANDVGLLGIEIRRAS